MSNEPRFPDPTDAPEELPPDLRAIDQRLTGDVALWRTRLPATDRLDAHARALPQRMAAVDMTSTPAPTRRTRAWEPPMHQQTPPTATQPHLSRARALFAASATVVLVGLLAALFVSISAHGGTSSGSSSGGPIHRVGSDGDARYIASAVTARAVDAEYNAVDPTQQFNINETVYVVLRVHGIAKGERHTLSMRWLLNANNANTAVDSPGRVTWTITGPSNLYFALVYSAAGNGIANVYWDTTHDQIGAPSTDARLAATLKFTIGPAVDTPTPTPTPTPAPLPPTPTPTPSSLPITILDMVSHGTADDGWAATADIHTQPNSHITGGFSVACGTPSGGLTRFDPNTTDSTGHATMLSENEGWDPNFCPGTITVKVVLTGTDPQGDQLAGSATCTLPKTGDEGCKQDG